MAFNAIFYTWKGIKISQVGEIWMSLLIEVRIAEAEVSIKTTDPDL